MKLDRALVFRVTKSWRWREKRPNRLIDVASIARHVSVECMNVVVMCRDVIDSRAVDPFVFKIVLGVVIEVNNTVMSWVTGLKDIGG
jgi:hypothetical protein